MFWFHVFRIRHIVTFLKTQLNLEKQQIKYLALTIVFEMSKKNTFVCNNLSSLSLTASPVWYKFSYQGFEHKNFFWNSAFKLFKFNNRLLRVIGCDGYPNDLKLSSFRNIIAIYFRLISSCFL